MNWRFAEWPTLASTMPATNTTKFEFEIFGIIYIAGFTFKLLN